MLNTKIIYSNIINFLFMYYLIKLEVIFIIIIIKIGMQILNLIGKKIYLYQEKEQKNFSY